MLNQASYNDIGIVQIAKTFWWIFGLCINRCVQMSYVIQNGFHFNWATKSQRLNGGLISMNRRKKNKYINVHKSYNVICVFNWVFIHIGPLLNVDSLFCVCFWTLLSSWNIKLTYILNQTNRTKNGYHMRWVPHLQCKFYTLQMYMKEIKFVIMLF